MTTGAVGSPVFSIEMVPVELKSTPQWVGWRFEERDGKPTKVPYNPNTGGMAASTKRETWATFDKATAEKLQRELDEAKVPATPRLLADDCTPEKLAGLMAANGGRISVLSSEAEILSQANGKYQSGAVNLNVFLKGHAGDDFRVGKNPYTFEFAGPINSHDGRWRAACFVRPHISTTPTKLVCVMVDGRTLEVVSDQKLREVHEGENPTHFDC